MPPDLKPPTLDALGRPHLEPADFCCPSCGSIGYEPTHVTGRTGQTFTLPFYQCLGCTVVFADPWRFMHQVQRTLDDRGYPVDKVTVGEDDRPKPAWQRAFWRGDGEPPGGWQKRPGIDPD